MADIEYTPLKGFYDLRKFDIPKELFQKFANIQKFLFKQEQQKEYLKKHNPTQWGETQILSAQYQQALFEFKESEQNG